MKDLDNHFTKKARHADTRKPVVYCEAFRHKESTTKLEVGNFTITIRARFPLTDDRIEEIAQRLFHMNGSQLGDIKRAMAELTGHTTKVNVAVTRFSF